MYMANAKILRRGPDATYIPLICVGGNANFVFRVWGKAYFRVFRYPHVGITNANSRVGGLTQRENLRWPQGQ